MGRSRLVHVHIIWLYTAYPKHIVEKKVIGREIKKQIHVITGIVVANSRRRTESIYYIKMYIISRRHEIEEWSEVEAWSGLDWTGLQFLLLFCCSHRKRSLSFAPLLCFRRPALLKFQSRGRKGYRWSWIWRIRWRVWKKSNTIPFQLSSILNLIIWRRRSSSAASMLCPFVEKQSLSFCR